MSDQPSINPTAASSASFSQSDIDTYSLYNQNYNEISVKIRLKSVSDPGVIKFRPGQFLQFNIRYTNGQAKFYYNNSEVQMIDLNNGNKSDDLNTPNSDNNSFNTLRYHPGSPGSPEDVINFTNKTYVITFHDRDGVDGGVSAVFNQTIEGRVIQTALSKA